VEVDFSKVPHGFGPKLLKAVRQSVREFLVPNQNGSKSPFRNKGMVEAEDDNVVIDYVKRMAKFSRVPDSGPVFQVSSMLAEKTQQSGSRWVTKPEDDPLVDLPLCRVSGNPSKNGKTAIGYLLDCGQVSVFEIRPDALVRRGKAHDVPLYPFILDGVAMNPALNQADGMHPNERGVAIMVDHIAPLVAKMIGEKS